VGQRVKHLVLDATILKRGNGLVNQFLVCDRVDLLCGLDAGDLSITPSQLLPDGAKGLVHTHLSVSVRLMKQ
jgi:hypothetical protein